MLLVIFLIIFLFVFLIRAFFWFCGITCTTVGTIGTLVIGYNIIFNKGCLYDPYLYLACSIGVLIWGIVCIVILFKTKSKNSNDTTTQ